MDALPSRAGWLFYCQRIAKDQSRHIYRRQPSQFIPNFFGNSSLFWTGCNDWGDYWCSVLQGFSVVHAS